jgi:hypothetical protein
MKRNAPSRVHHLPVVPSFVAVRSAIHPTGAPIAMASSDATSMEMDATLAGEVDPFDLLNEQQLNGCVVALATCLRTLCVRTLALVSLSRLASTLPPVPLYDGSP